MLSYSDHILYVGDTMEYPAVPVNRSKVGPARLQWPSVLATFLPVELIGKSLMFPTLKGICVMYVASSFIKVSDVTDSERRIFLFGTRMSVL